MIGNEFFDVGGVAVHVGAFGPALRTAYPPRMSGGTSTADTLANRIENNQIEGFGRVYHDCPGILDDWANFTKIIHNEVSCGKWTGISTGWDWAPYGPTNAYWNGQGDQGWGTQIHNNKIHDVMTELADGAAIYAPGNHTNVQDDWSQGTCFGTGGSASVFGSIQNNWISDIHIAGNFTPSRVSGIYLESGSRGWHIAGNVLERIDYPFHLNPVDGGVKGTYWNYHSWAANHRPNVSIPVPDGGGQNTNYVWSGDNLAGCIGYTGGSPGCHSYVFDASLGDPSNQSIPYLTLYADYNNPPPSPAAIEGIAGPQAPYTTFFATPEPLIDPLAACGISDYSASRRCATGATTGMARMSDAA